MESVYEDEEVIITKMAQRVGEPHYYQIESKREEWRRQAKGYLLISPGTLQRICKALSEVVF